MTFMPNSNKKGIITAAALILLSIVVGSAAKIALSYALYFNLVSFVLLIAGLYLTLRFSISKYVYEVDSQTLTITKITGSRKETVASLDLITGIGCVKKPKTSQEKDEYKSRFGKTDLRMNYCRNFLANKYIYVTEFNGKIYEIYLEISAEFSVELNNKLLDIKNKIHEEGE